MFAAILGIASLCLVGLFSTGSPPATADGQTPTFAPVVTSPPSPTPVVTARPPPLSRPEDARGIQQTTPPFHAPAVFSPPPAPPVLWLSTASSFSVPCALHAERVFVPIVLNGKPATFILDSAAPYSAIDPAVAPSHSVPITLHTVQIGDVRFNSIAAGVDKIGSYARTYLGASADGVLGQELFMHYPVRIDYRGCMVTIYRDSASARAAMTAAAHSVSLQMIQGQPVVTARFDGGVDALLVVDTSSDAEADITRRFADSSRLASLANELPMLMRASPGGELSGETARARSLVFDSIVVERPVIGILGGTAQQRDWLAGYIGDGLLDQFTALFDEPGNALLLEPIAGAPHARDRSGAWLIVRPAGVTIRSVLPDSPAAKAGLHGGDRILAVNGEAVRDLDALRALFAGASGSSLRVTYLRSARQRTTVLVLRQLI